MKRILGTVVSLTALAAVGAGVVAPENSRLFVRHVDETSGVVSYLLKPGLIAENQQHLYFTARSMTDDGRFLIVVCSCNEYKAFDVPRERAEKKFAGKRFALIDLRDETFRLLDGIPEQQPCLDVERDELYYLKRGATPASDCLCKRALKDDPAREIVLCPMPAELTKGAKRVTYFNHLTLSHDRTLAFLDSRVDDRFVQGVLDIRTGRYERWHGDDSGQWINHGQINPVRNDLALCARECVEWTDSKGVVHDEMRNWNKKHPDEPYPRLQLVEKGRMTMVPARCVPSGYATHERWNEQGDGFYWCGEGKVWMHDLATGRQEMISPKGAHAFLSRDRQLVVSDIPVGSWWRGCAWKVHFHNRASNRGVDIFTSNPAMCTKKCESRLHPDPHPQFVCRDRYVISTKNNADGHLDYAVTPVDQLKVLTAPPSFTMRIDDNHAPEEWRRVASIFEARGMRLSLAVNPARLTEAQGACLRELAARGHVLMDHTPNHTFYTVTYHDRAAFDRAKAKPFVRDADERSMTIHFNCEVLADDPETRRLPVTLVSNEVVFAGAEAKCVKPTSTYVSLPGRSEVCGIQQKGGKLLLCDFWRRPLAGPLPSGPCEITVYGRAALQPCDDMLRELLTVSRERFDHFGLPRPTVWVRPGGWDPGIDWERLERIYGREGGFIGADTRLGRDVTWGGQRWTTGYDRMYFFDQGADITPEQLVDEIEKNLRAGRFFVTLSHMWSGKLPGGFEEYCRKTERFADLLVERKIPTLTMSESLAARFGSPAANR